ncbi:MAG: hypothetical protein ABIO36_11150 [Pyrinomonadaceae bacterium]
MTIFLDAAPFGGGFGIFAAVVFFLVFAAVAFIAFKLLRKTVKMAFRMAIVAIILVIAVAGSISFWWLSGSKTGRPERPRATQPK